jgi:peptide/nickel transport system ATP-binding protein
MTALLTVDNLQTEFTTRDGVLRAVQGVSFELNRGEVLGLVGESGSGKSVTGFSIMGLVDPPGRVAGGSVKFDGRELVGQSEEQLRQLRGKRIAMIFQDPMMTLNPVLSVATQMVETVLAHDKVSKAVARERAIDALGRVGIASPESRLAQYPHQFSGGMRQRVAIAIALLHRPDLIIADEPTTALDVTVQGQILYEMQTLVREVGSALIWITHDLAVIAGLADRVAVMYAGRIVEEGPVEQVLDAPRHPYTRGLLDSVPANNAALDGLKGGRCGRFPA